MPRINISQAQAIAILPVINAPNGSTKVVNVVIKKYKRPIKKGDRLVLYAKNYNGRWQRFGCVECKTQRDVSEKEQELTLKNTYDRRYYLNRRVKSAGFSLELELTSKTILVPPEMVTEAMNNGALRELGKRYNYGIQFTLNHG